MIGGALSVLYVLGVSWDSLSAYFLVGLASLFAAVALATIARGALLALDPRHWRLWAFVIITSALSSSQVLAFPGADVGLLFRFITSPWRRPRDSRRDYGNKVERLRPAGCLAEP